MWHSLKKSIVLSLIAGAMLLGGCLPPPGTDIEVETENGTLVGKQHQGLLKFLGVPYAQSPQGALRWQAPQPHPSWESPREAYYQPQACVQGGSPTAALGSQENCLHLNIWAPDTEGPHPVMLWIHGGGFLIGSANEIQYDGAYLAKSQDVVVVSINYRLSFLGFLSLPQFEGTPTHNVNGNQGLLDQLAALQWVKNNVNAFGGSPDNITVFGESAGSISTCVLLASPLTDGLINKAIMQSGSCDTFPTTSKAAAEQAGVEFITDIGCIDDTDPLQCARKLSHQQLQSKLGVKPNELLREDVSNWAFFPTPTLDDHLLPKLPMTLLAESEKEQPISLILGTNADEGSLFVGMQDHAGTPEGYLQSLTELQGEQAAAIAELYPFEDFSSSGEAISQITSDGVMTCRSRGMADIWSQNNPVYFYHFTQTVSAPLMGIFELAFTENAADLGTFHASEIPYVFGINGFLGQLKTPAQKATSHAIMNYWGNFARTGNPNSQDQALNNWPLYSSAQPDYLIINPDLQSATDLRGRYCEYWISNPLHFQHSNP